MVRDFKEWVYSKQTVSDHMQMKGVINIFRNDGKQPVKSITKSKSFYAAALKLTINHINHQPLTALTTFKQCILCFSCKIKWTVWQAKN